MRALRAKLFGLGTKQSEVVSVEADENGPTIDFALESDDERGCALIEGLWRELSALANDYPKFVRVTVK